MSAPPADSRDGAPCWVDTMQPDPREACAFYGPLFAWDIVDSAPAQDEPVGDEQLVALVRGHRTYTDETLAIVADLRNAVLADSQGGVISISARTP